MNTARSNKQYSDTSNDLYQHEIMVRLGEPDEVQLAEIYQMTAEEYLECDLEGLLAETCKLWTYRFAIPSITSGSGYEWRDTFDHDTVMELYHTIYIEVLPAIETLRANHWHLSPRDRINEIIGKACNIISTRIRAYFYKNMSGVTSLSDVRDLKNLFSTWDIGGGDSPMVRVQELDWTRTDPVKELSISERNQIDERKNLVVENMRPFLSDKQYILLRMFYIEGLPISMAAMHFDQTEEAIRWQFKQITQKVCSAYGLDDLESKILRDVFYLRIDVKRVASSNGLTVDEVRATIQQLIERFATHHRNHVQ